LIFVRKNTTRPLPTSPRRSASIRNSPGHFSTAALPTRKMATAPAPPQIAKGRSNWIQLLRKSELPARSSSEGGRGIISSLMEEPAMRLICSSLVCAALAALVIGCSGAETNSKPAVSVHKDDTKKDGEKSGGDTLGSDWADGGSPSGRGALDIKGGGTARLKDA